VHVDRECIASSHAHGTDRPARRIERRAGAGFDKPRLDHAYADEDVDRAPRGQHESGEDVVA
jgi:hypothetical protein